MESPGQYLRRERELRGVSLQDLSDVLKLSKQTLRSLERDDYEDLPHTTFVRGFIRSYCRHLGIDENDAILRFDIYLKELAEEGEKDGNAWPEGAKTALSLQSNAVVVGVLVAVGVLIILLFMVFSRVPADKTGPAPDAPISEVPELVEPSLTDLFAPAEAPAPPASPSPPVPPAPPTSPPPMAVVPTHTVVVEATEITWIGITIDNGEPFDVTLDIGESVRWKSVDSVSMLIGNAGGVVITFDNKPLGRLGNSGEVVRVELPKGR